MDPRIQQCGFAKLVGDDFEYYMRKYEINLGRKSKTTELDVVLGENTNVSRNHACIRYNFAQSYFELVVQGKNGVYVEGILHTPGSAPVRLSSQNLIQMGDKSFFFLLPKSSQTAPVNPGP